MSKGPAILLGLSVLLGLLPLPFVGGQGGSTVSIQSLQEAAVDRDGNGLYDELTFEVTLAVQEDGRYLVQAILRDSGDEHVASWGSGGRELVSGVHPELVSFPGATIRSRGADGPYALRVHVTQIRSSFDWTTMAWYNHTTAPYKASAFDPPDIQLTPPFTEEVRDTDGDGLFDELLVHVSFRVLRTTRASFSGSLGLKPCHSVYGGHPLQTWEPGERSVAIAFSGRGIYGMGADGPYRGSIVVDYEDYGQVERSTTFETAAYRAVDFQRTSADLGGVEPTSSLQDTDADGFANFLQLEVPVEIREEGDYVLTAYIWISCEPGESHTHPDVHAMHLTEGTHTVAFSYSGILLGRTLSDGPYTIDFTARRVGPDVHDQREYRWTTPAYRRSEFESRAVAWFNGTVRMGATGEPVPHATLRIVDPAERFEKTAHTDSSGRVSVEAYEGEFLVEVRAGPLFHAQEYFERILITDGLNREFLLSPPQQNTIRYDLHVESWTSVSVTVSTSWSSGTGRRESADRSGNFDGTANATEVAQAARVILALAQRQDPLELELGGAPMAVAAVSNYRAEGYGEVVSDLPLNESYEITYEGPTGLSTNASPSLTLRPPYDTERIDYRVLIHLTAGTSVVFQGDDDVSLRRVDEVTWEVDPQLLESATHRAQITLTASPSEGPLDDPVARGILVLLPTVSIGVVAFLWLRRRRGQ